MVSLIHYQIYQEKQAHFRIKAPVQAAGLNTYWELCTENFIFPFQALSLIIKAYNQAMWVQSIYLNVIIFMLGNFQIFITHDLYNIV